VNGWALVRFLHLAGIALVVIVVTGAALASLAVLVLVFVLIGQHVATPYTGALSIAALVASLVVFWLGVKLVYG
jgi:hypothetical protein